MSKCIVNMICAFCESQYKLSYEQEDASGYPKFCCFCGEACQDEDHDTDKDDDLD